MDDLSRDSVFPIWSSSGSRDQYGTGFLVHYDGQFAYIVTCEHVVRDFGEQEIMVDNFPATRAASLVNGVDLAVLRVEGLKDKRPLRLRRAPNEEGKSFRMAGFIQPINEEFKFRQLQGIFRKHTSLWIPQQTFSVEAWDLIIDEVGYQFLPGNSGSPVADDSNYIVAVVKDLQGDGKSGTAISIEALEKVWPSMPPGLFEQDRVVTIENKPDLIHSRGIVGNTQERLLPQPLQPQWGGRSHPAIRLKPMPQGMKFAAMTSVLFQRVSRSSTRLMRLLQNRTINAIIAEWSETIRTENPLILIFDFAADIEFALFSISQQLNSCRWIDGSGFIDASLATWREEERSAVNIDDLQAAMFLVDFSAITPGHIFKEQPEATGKAAPITFVQRLSLFLSWAKATHRHVVIGIPKYVLTEVDFVAFQKLTEYLFLPEKLFSITYLDRVQQCEHHLRRKMPFPDLLIPLVCANSSSLPLVLGQLLSEITMGQMVIDEQDAIAVLLDLARNLTTSGFYEIAFRIEQYYATLKVKRKSIDLQVDVYLDAEDENDRIVSSLNTVTDLPFILQYGAITGEAGQGKTTSLHQIEHQWTIPRSGAVGKSIDTYLPLYISLLPDSEFDLLKQIERTLGSDMFAQIDGESKSYRLACHVLVSELKSFSSLQRLFSSSILLLLDNVDALSIFSQTNLKENSSKLRASSQEPGILMAFREEGIPQLQHLHRAKLQPLNEKQVKALSSRRGNARISSLLYQNAGSISSYVRNPLLLEIICALGLTDEDLRDVNLNTLLTYYVDRARSQLESSYAKRIIDEWLPERARHDLLGNRRMSVSKDHDMSEFIHLASQVGLLTNRSGDRMSIEFQFDYLRDYFLAQHLAQDIRHRGIETVLTALMKDTEKLRQNIMSRENIFKILINQIEKKNINEYIEFLNFKANQPRLAHICLLELGPGPHQVAHPPALQLLQTIEDGNKELEKRIAAAHILGSLDPRIPSLQKIQMALIDIPASERLPQYRIAKYSVTNMEFARFVQAQGYQNREYWTDPGWKWLQSNKIRFPLYWSHEKLNRPNYPIVGVSFFEAKAYCAWLSKQVQRSFDVPSVFQWDRVAHGSEQPFELLLELYRETLLKRKVPDKSILQKQIAQRKSAKASKTKSDEPDTAAESGQELDIGVENKLIDELLSIANASMQPYLEQMKYALPLPIGMFPGNGIGCHDLYGNVWEWTSTVFSHVENYLENVLLSAPVNPGESVFVKGGARGVVNSAIWTMLGGWFDPSVRFHKLGFRVALIENLERS